MIVVTISVKRFPVFYFKINTPSVRIDLPCCQSCLPVCSDSNVLQGFILMAFWLAMHLLETSPFDLFIYAISLIMLYSPNYSLIVSTKDYAVPCCLNAYIYR
jgi:hypothetical protein